MITYVQTEPDLIQTSEIFDDGSGIKGIIIKGNTKTRQVQDGTEEVKVGTEQVQIGTEEVSIGFDEAGVELFETQPIFENQDVLETQPKFITETFSPWDELDPDLVDWLIMPDYLAEQAEAEALASFKSSRETSIQNKVVIANGHMFHADLWSKTQMNEAIAVLVEEGSLDTEIVQWSLHGTPSGYMTDVTLADLKLARKLAQQNVSAVWGK
jgi:hypothetical protein